MARTGRYLNISLIPHSKARVVSRTISYRALKAAGLVSGLLLGLVIFLVGNYGRVYLRALNVELLARRNADLEAEHTKIEQLERELAILKMESSKVKTMLGIEVSPQVVNLSSHLAEAPEETAIEGDELSGPGEGSSPEMAPLFKEQEKLLRAMPSLWPVKGWVTARYSRTHPALDMAAPLGTPIQAAGDGVVSFVGWDEDLGNILRIDHGEGFGTLYGHCSRTLVERGELVRRGEVIGFVGSSGKSTGPHLHYEVWVKGMAVNPEGYLFW